MAKALRTKAGENLTARILTINPSVAKEMLLGAKKNRNIQRARVRRYSDGMKLGEWVVAQPIMIDADGKLIDGQHRLNAVVQSHKAVDFLVISGFEYENVFCRLDDVARRTLRDWLHMSGVESPKITAGVIFWAARDLKGLIPPGRGAAFAQTPVEGIEFLDEHPEIKDSVAAPAVINRYLPWVMSAFCHWKFYKYDKALSSAFFIDLTMDDLRLEGDPIYLLRERMKSDKIAKEKMNSTEKLALVYKAFNACREDKSLHTLRWRSQGPTAEAFPEVI